SPGRRGEAAREVRRSRSSHRTRTMAAIAPSPMAFLWLWSLSNGFIGVDVGQRSSLIDPLRLSMAADGAAISSRRGVHLPDMLLCEHTGKQGHRARRLGACDNTSTQECKGAARAGRSGMGMGRRVAVIGGATAPRICCQTPSWGVLVVRKQTSPKTNG